jgi:hypothetical protein
VARPRRFRRAAGNARVSVRRHACGVRQRSGMTPDGKLASDEFAAQGALGLIGAIVIASVGPSVLSIIVTGLIVSVIVLLIEVGAYQRGRRADRLP